MQLLQEAVQSKGRLWMDLEQDVLIKKLGRLVIHQCIAPLFRPYRWIPSELWQLIASNYFKKWQMWDFTHDISGARMVTHPPNLVLQSLSWSMAEPNAPFIHDQVVQYTRDVCPRYFTCGWLWLTTCAMGWYMVLETGLKYCFLLKWPVLQHQPLIIGKIHQVFCLPHHQLVPRLDLQDWTRHTYIYPMVHQNQRPLIKYFHILKT